MEYAFCTLYKTPKNAGEIKVSSVRHLSLPIYFYLLLVILKSKTMVYELNLFFSFEHAVVVFCSLVAPCCDSQKYRVNEYFKLVF